MKVLREWQRDIIHYRQKKRDGHIGSLANCYSMKEVVQDVLKILMRDIETEDNLKVAWERVIVPNL